MARSTPSEALVDSAGDRHHRRRDAHPGELAVGQLVMGPLSDRYGRRPPLVASTAVCVLAGAASALAPNIAVLAVARLVQGFAGAGGMVIGRAVIADLVTGRAAARAFTLMVAGCSGRSPGCAC